ncbi:TPA: hypothetical protein DEG21_05300 [Patescibacteria group bacterium]|nr:hypothetical protein [Candidatus Gracilibacteria bacterium]HBY75245.1 hypothetical protein [Candidatus Gracilibacteria bacterium]
MHHILVVIPQILQYELKNGQLVIYELQFHDLLVPHMVDIINFEEMILDLLCHGQLIVGELDDNDLVHLDIMFQLKQNGKRL